MLAAAAERDGDICVVCDAMAVAVAVAVAASAAKSKGLMTVYAGHPRVLRNFYPQRPCVATSPGTWSGDVRCVHAVAACHVAAAASALTT